MVTVQRLGNIFDLATFTTIRECTSVTLTCIVPLEEHVGKARRATRRVRRFCAAAFRQEDRHHRKRCKKERTISSLASACHLLNKASLSITTAAMFVSRDVCSRFKALPLPPVKQPSSMMQAWSMFSPPYFC